jgi:hypothetical protein
MRMDTEVAIERLKNAKITTQPKVLKELECGSICLGTVKGGMHAHAEYNRGFYDGEHFLDAYTVFEKPKNHLEVRRR